MMGAAYPEVSLSLCDAIAIDRLLADAFGDEWADMVDRNRAAVIVDVAARYEMGRNARPGRRRYVVYGEAVRDLVRDLNARGDGTYTPIEAYAREVIAREPFIDAGNPTFTTVATRPVEREGVHETTV